MMLNQKLVVVMTKRGFGELELAILNILKSGEKMTVKDVHHLLGEKDKYTTIMTVMLRLTEKKALARERIGTHYEYWLLTAPKGKISSFIDQFQKKIFGIKTTDLICHLIENAKDVSEEDLKEMEMILEKVKTKRKQQD